MKNTAKNKLIHRILAVLMAIVVLLRIMPLTNADILAATAVHADGITVSVTDESGAPLSGASVLYTIDSIKNGKKYKAGNLTTDETGAAVILEGSLYASGDLSLSAVVSKTGYQTDGITIADAGITSDRQDFQVILKRDLVSWEASEEVSEDTSKEENMNASSSETVNEEENMPKAADNETPKEEFGKKEIPVQTQKSQTENTMLPAEEEDIATQVIEGISFVPYTGVYDGKEHDAVEAVHGAETGDTFRYKLENGSWEQEIPKIENAGTYQVYVEVTRGAEQVRLK